MARVQIYVLAETSAACAALEPTRSSAARQVLARVRRGFHHALPLRLVHRPRVALRSRRDPTGRHWQHQHTGLPILARRTTSQSRAHWRRRGPRARAGGVNGSRVRGQTHNTAQATAQGRARATRAGCDNGPAGFCGYAAFALTRGSGRAALHLPPESTGCGWVQRSLHKKKPPRVRIWRIRDCFFVSWIGAALASCGAGGARERCPCA